MTRVVQVQVGRLGSPCSSTRVEVVPGEVLLFQCPHLGVGDLDAFGVDGVVELGGDLQLTERTTLCGSVRLSGRKDALAHRHVRDFPRSSEPQWCPSWDVAHTPSAEQQGHPRRHCRAHYRPNADLSGRVIAKDHPRPPC